MSAPTTTEKPPRKRDRRLMLYIDRPHAGVMRTLWASSTMYEGHVWVFDTGGEKIPLGHIPGALLYRFKGFRTYTECRAYFDATPSAGPQLPNVRHFPNRGLRTARLVDRGESIALYYRKARLLTWYPDGRLTYHAARQRGADRLLTMCAGGGHTHNTAVPWSRNTGDLTILQLRTALCPREGEEPVRWRRQAQAHTAYGVPEGAEVPLRAVEHEEWVQWVPTDPSVFVPFQKPSLQRAAARAAYRAAGIPRFMQWLRAREALAPVEFDRTMLYQRPRRPSVQVLAKLQAVTHYDTIVRYFAPVCRRWAGGWRLDLTAIERRLQKAVQTTMGGAGLTFTTYPVVNGAEVRVVLEAARRYRHMCSDYVV